MTAEQQRIFRANRIAKGLCIECKAKAVKGKRRCKKHLKRDVKRHAGKSTARYLERKKAGLCVQCGKVPTKKFLMCQQCRNDLSATSYRKKSIAQFEIPKSRSDAHLPLEDVSYQTALQA
jgi:hypothetical protein